MEVLQRTANRGSISDGGYDVDNSVKLQTSGVNSEFFSYTVSSTGSRTKGTVSMWIKRTSFGTTQFLWEQGNTNSESGRLFVRFDTNDTLRIATGSTVLRVTNRVFRDASAWYHIVVAIDTTSSTADNRTRLYVNGVEETSFSTKNNFSQNDSTGMNFEKQRIGQSTVDAGSYATFNGYMAEVFGADGLVYDASDFGEFDSASSIWKPKDLSAISSSVGTNGFYMKFENAAGMGANSAGSGHGFSVQNINQNDQATDVPSNNFCTLNPLMENTGSANYLTLTEGATKTVNSSASYKARVASMGVTSGKWYWEMISTQFTAVSTLGVNYPENWSSGTSFYGTMYVNDNGTGVRYNNSSRIPNFGNGWSGTTINIGFALDMDATPPTCTVYENGSSIGNLMAGLSIGGAGGAYLPPKEVGYFPYISNYSNNTILANFGGYVPAYLISSAASDANGYGTFEYAPPSGYYALCTKNLAEYG